jgi:hypothetical protein
MAVLTAPRRRSGKSKSKPKPKRKQPEAVLRIGVDEYRKLTDEQRAKYCNPLGDIQQHTYVNGHVILTNPYDVLLDPIFQAVSKTIAHDLYPPDEEPIEEEKVVDGYIVRTYRRRTDYECGMAHFGLCLPDAWFDCRNNAFENAAVALEGIAKILTDAASRVRAIESKGGAR